MYHVHMTFIYSLDLDAALVRDGLLTLLLTNPGVSATVGGSGTMVTFDGTAATELAAKAFVDAATAVWNIGSRSSQAVGLSRIA